MFWFIPIAIGVAVAGKKIYDAVSDDSSSSSSSNSYSDNSAEREREARRAKEKRDQAIRKERLNKQLQSAVQSELESLSHHYLRQNVSLDKDHITDISAFTKYEIENANDAKEALSFLSNSEIALKPSINEKKYKKIRDQVAALDQLEEKLQEL